MEIQEARRDFYNTERTADDRSLNKVRGLMALEKARVGPDDLKSLKQGKDILSEFVKDKTLDPSVEDNFLIIYAARNGHRKLVKLLLRDYRVNAADQSNLAIKEAAIRGHLEIVELLMTQTWVDNGCHEKLASKALESGHLEIAKRLSNFKIFLDNINQTLWKAADSGDLLRFKICMAYPTADPSKYRNGALRSASKRNNIIMVKDLLEDPRVNASDGPEYEFDSLGWAIRNDNVEIFKLLLAHPNTVISDENILMTSKHERVDILEILLKDARADPAANDNECVKAAVKYGRVKTVKLLLEDPRVDPSANNNECVKIAVCYGQFETLQLLLRDPRVDPTVIDAEDINECIFRGVLIKEAEGYNYYTEQYMFRSDYDDEDYQCIIQEAKHRHSEMLKVLLQDPRLNIPALKLTRKNRRCVNYFKNKMERDLYQTQLALGFVGIIVGDGWKDMMYEVGRRLHV